MYNHLSRLTMKEPGLNGKGKRDRHWGLSYEIEHCMDGLNLFSVDI